MIPNATWSVPSASRAIAWLPVAASAESWVSAHEPGVPVASQAVCTATWFSTPSSISPYTIDAVPSGATTRPTLPSGAAVVRRSIDHEPPASVPYQTPGSVPCRATAT